MSLIKQDTKQVLLPFPMDKAYDYAVPEGYDELSDGAYVCAPLGSREVPAVVWGEGVGDAKPNKLKSLVSVYDVPPMPAVHRKFLDWVASYTMAPKGSVLKLTLSVAKALEPPSTITGYALGEEKEGEGGLSPAAKRVLEVASDLLPRRLSELASEAECSTGVIKTLYKKDYLRTVELQAPPPCRNPDPARGGALLSGPQKEAADHLTQMVDKKEYGAALLTV